MKPANQLLDFAKEVVQAAGDLTLRHFRSAELSVEYKGDGSPVTVADRDAETLIREAIAEQFPNDSILGEEHGQQAGSGSLRQWVIDPIDGTKSFTAGVPLYSNLLAVIENGEPILGIINLPGLTEMLWATKGSGAFCNGEQIRVSQRSELAGSYATTSGIGTWKPEVLHSLDEAGMIVRTWGDAYGYSLVATGRAEAMIDPTCSIWDIAPVGLIVTEAGGRFSDLAGTEHVFGGNGLATNAKIHAEMLNLVGDCHSGS